MQLLAPTLEMTKSQLVVILWLTPRRQGKYFLDNLHHLTNLDMQIAIEERERKYADLQNLRFALSTRKRDAFRYPAEWYW